MTLLSTVKTVMDSNGWPAPTSSVASSSDQNMRQAYALANKALLDTSYKKDWPQLIYEHTFTTVEGQVEYPLPEDYHHLVAPSAWNSSQYYQMKGSLTPSQWYRMILRGAPPNFLAGFRLDARTKTFNITPAPTGGMDIVFMYVTKNLAVDASGNPVERYSQDSDIAVIDEEMVELNLTWRWRQKKGLDFTAEMAEYNGALKRRWAQIVGYGELDVGGRPPLEDWPLTQPYIPAPFTGP